MRSKVERLEDDRVFASENENSMLLPIVMESEFVSESGCLFVKHPELSLFCS